MSTNTITEITKLDYTLTWINRSAELAVVDVDVAGEHWSGMRAREWAGSPVFGPGEYVTRCPTLRMSILFGPDGHVLLRCDAKDWRASERESVIAEHVAEARRRYVVEVTNVKPPEQ